MADPNNPSGAEPNSPEMEKFMHGLAAFQKSASSENTEQIEAAAMEMLAAAAEHAEKNPTPELGLKMEATECEARGDWGGAETCYRKVLALEEANGNQGLISKAHLDLGKLFLLIGQIEKAEACTLAATVAARQAGVFPLLVMVLEQRNICALARSDFAAGLAAASEAVEVIEPGPLYDGLRAGAWVNRARCRMACGDWTGCESDLTASQPILVGRDTSPLFGGVHSRAARWWEVMAGVRAHQEDLRGACEAWAEAVRIRRHVVSLEHLAGPYPLASLARALHGSSAASEAAGDTDGANAAAAEAQRIWSELGLKEQPWR